MIDRSRLRAHAFATSVKLRACLFFFGAIATSRGNEGTLRDLTEKISSLPGPIPAEQSHGRIGFYGAQAEPARIVIDLGRDVTPDEVVLFPARLPTSISTGDGSNGFPPSLSVSITGGIDSAQPVRLARWSEESPGAGNRLPFLRLSGNGAVGRYLTVEIETLRPRETGRGRFVTLGEIVVLEKGINAALLRPVTTTASIENAPRWQVSNLTDGYLWCLPFAGKEQSPSNGYHSLIETSGGSPPKWVEVDLGHDTTIDELHLIPAHPRDFADTAGFGFPPRFRVTGRSEGGMETVIFDPGNEPYPNPGAAPVILPGTRDAVRHLRIEARELWRRTDDYIFALAELQVWSSGENAAAGKTVTAADTTTTGLWSPEALTDGFSSRAGLLSWTIWLDALSEREELQKKADTLALLIAEKREETLRRRLYGAALAVVLIAFVAILVILAQRRRASRAAEELKRRIASDLHDELGASLSHLALQSDLARGRIADDDPVAARLASISDSARETLDNMRDVIWLLAPSPGSWEDLQNRMENIADRLLEGIDHQFEAEGDPPHGSPPIEWARELVLFLKESLTNARKHAGAKSVDVRIQWKAASLTLQTTDDGSGFDPLSMEPGRGRGLLNFQARARFLGGSCRLDSAPGNGTTVILEIPLPRS